MDHTFSAFPLALLVLASTPAGGEALLSAQQLPQRQERSSFTPHPPRTTHSPLHPRAAQPLMAASSPPAGEGGSRLAAFQRWFIARRSLILLLCLVLHKCSTDGLTRWTRVQGDYSKHTMAIMSEVAKFPLIALAISTIGGGAKEIGPVLSQSIRKKPFQNLWIALCYTFNNLLYFDALSALSAVAYQVLSQSKTLFTAGLMYAIVGKRLIMRQVAALSPGPRVISCHQPQLPCIDRCHLHADRGSSAGAISRDGSQCRLTGCRRGRWQAQLESARRTSRLTVMLP